MGKMISVYTQKRFEEYILPPVNNTDYNIVLHKNSFEMEADLKLLMEVVDGRWKINPSEEYVIDREGRQEAYEVLQDNDILTIETRNHQKFSVIVKEISNTFNAFEKYVLNQESLVEIGKGPDNTVVYDYQGLVSKKHACIFFENGKWFIKNSGKNGLYVNFKYVCEQEELQFGDYINIIGLHMVFLETVLAVDSSSRLVRIDERIHQKYDIQYSKFSAETGELKKEKKVFHRSPRSLIRLETEAVAIEEPPMQNQAKQQPLFMTIGPSFTMALPMMLGCFLMMYSSRASGAGMGLYMYSGLIMSLSSAAIGVGWALVNISYQRKKEKEEELHRFDAYGEYLKKKTEEIRKKYEKNIQLLKERYLEPAECAAFDENSPKLWNRNVNQADFLLHRLGIGEMPFQVPIEIPKEKFKLWNDSLNEKPRLIYENYHMLYNVPLEVDLLKKSLIGVIGGRDKRGALEVTRILSTQIAANHCYTDVKLAYIYDRNSSADLRQWEFAKWFPHVWSEDRKIRFVAGDNAEASEVFYELTKIFRRREESRKETEQNSRFMKPHFILFVSDVKILESELLAKYIYAKDSRLGLTTILLTDRYENLPNDCEYIIQNDIDFQGIYDVYEPEDKRCRIRFDQIGAEELEQFARKLSNIEVLEAEQGGEIPQSLTFFDMYHVGRPEDLNVLERWKKNRTYDNIRALIGEKAGGASCFMDVHEKYHGPHGLVAGTTGSGKSETLQTYMLSLAINYSPDDVAYFIIDYKGGGMANLFLGLPHMIGQISNLSGNQVRRAMVSIKSENRRRQRVFNENGVNNINAYTKLYKNGEADRPVPHLFIIIDEFAELKREEPEFMRELISVAQVGRSLGVHLILATQKPSGTVDDNIWSNSKFRLCLRVQDKQDSMDMLHKPDAAYITQAGRCYLQVGNDEVYELFQSGFSGALYEGEADSGKLDIARLLTTTGRAELLGGYAKISKKQKAAAAWVQKLVEALREAEISGNVVAAECLDGKLKMQRLIDAIYEVLKENGIDYARNCYNSARLEDFIRLYAKLEGEDRCIRIWKMAEAGGIKLPQAKERTQLDAVKDYLARLAKENHYQHDLKLWMPVLPDRIYLEEFEEYGKIAFSDGRWFSRSDEWMIEAVMGKADDPQNQAQMPLVISLSEDGNLAVIGSVLSGKSTFLQTLAYSLITGYTPDYLNLYALDFSSKMMSAFEEAPHFGGVMYENDMDKIAKFFNLMEHQLEERKKLFRGGNYSQYVQVKGVVLPAIVILIDNYSAFMEKTGEKYYDDVIKLSKEGVSHGIYLVLAAFGFGMNEIQSRVAENIKNVITLELADKFAYADALHTKNSDVLPESGIKGRGLAVFGERVLEFQTALALCAEDDYSRLESIRRKCMEMGQAWKGKRARRIPEIPEKPLWFDFVRTDEVNELSREKNLLPVAYNAADASVYALDLRKIYCYLITGLPRSGKKCYMKAIIQSAILKESEIAILDTEDKKLHLYEGNEKTVYLSDPDTVHSYFLNNVFPVFHERNLKKWDLIRQDLEEDEIFDIMAEEKPWFLFITDLAAFLSMLDKEFLDGERKNMKILVERGRLHHIYFIACMQVADKSKLTGNPIYEAFRNYKKGIHFGGNVVENTIFTFENIPYREQSKSLPPGIGLIANVESAQETERIVVPLVKRSKLSGDSNMG